LIFHYPKVRNLQKEKERNASIVSLKNNNKHFKNLIPSKFRPRSIQKPVNLQKKEIEMLVKCFDKKKQKKKNFEEITFEIPFNQIRKPTKVKKIKTFQPTKKFGKKK
jgi:hypothetical protein